jgi:excisionase family DNA binding protein
VNFDELLTIAKTLPQDQLPDFLGELERVRAHALARFMSPAPAPPGNDQLLDVAEAAARLSCSVDYLYHHPELPFVRRIGRGLRFSATGIDVWIEQQNNLTARQHRNRL